VIGARTASIVVGSDNRYGDFVTAVYTM